MINASQISPLSRTPFPSQLTRYEWKIYITSSSSNSSSSSSSNSSSTNESIISSLKLSLFLRLTCPLPSSRSELASMVSDSMTVSDASASASASTLGSSCVDCISSSAMPSATSLVVPPTPLERPLSVPSPPPEEAMVASVPVAATLLPRACLLSSAMTADIVAKVAAASLSSSPSIFSIFATSFVNAFRLGASETSLSSIAWLASSCTTETVPGDVTCAVM